MTKHRKYKKTYKRSQRGGIWPFSESDPTAPSLTSQASNWFESKKSGAENSWGSWFGSTPETVPTTYPTTPTTYPTTPTTYPTTPTTYPTQSSVIEGNSNMSTVGGKRKRMRGGKGGLGLTYYATPVSGIKVVEPNEWLLYNNGVNQKGGSRKYKRRSRKHKHKSRKHKHKSRKH
jgi:hypothetical protein